METADTRFARVCPCALSGVVHPCFMYVPDMEQGQKSPELLIHKVSHQGEGTGAGIWT